MLTLSLITHRRLFGRVYGDLQPDYFDHMPSRSGVFVKPIVETRKLIPKATSPGDIDLLIIPYEEDQLMLDRCMAIEVKIVKASFANQGKSPNQFGISQARFLCALGFPYVGVVHLIISDQSPLSSWQEVAVFRVLNWEGQAARMPSQLVDWLPANLINRNYGRLLKAGRADAGIGLAACYLETRHRTHLGKSLSAEWLPLCRPAQFNNRASDETLTCIADYFDREYNTFLDTPRHDPD